MQAKAKLDAAIAEFEEAVRLDPTLPEARLNLGEVYLSQQDSRQGRGPRTGPIVKLLSASVNDRETIDNFSQAHFGLAQSRHRPQGHRRSLRRSSEGPGVESTKRRCLAIAGHRTVPTGEYREGEKCLTSLLAMLPAARRRVMAEQFGKQFETTGKTKEAVRAWTFLGWAFATSPEPRLIDAKRRWTCRSGWWR